MFKAPTDRQLTTDRYVSQPELCKYLNYSTSTIRRYRRRGMPCGGSDRLRRYHIGTVLQWLSQRPEAISAHLDTTFPRKPRVRGDMPPLVIDKKSEMASSMISACYEIWILIHERKK